MLERINPEAAARYGEEAQSDVHKKFELYAHMASMAADSGKKED